MSKRLKEFSRLMSAHDPLAVLTKTTSPLDDLLVVAPDDDARAKLHSLFGMAAHQKGEQQQAFDYFTKAWHITKRIEPLKNALTAGSGSPKAPSANGMQALFEIATNQVEDMADSVERAELADSLCHVAGNSNTVIVSGESAKATAQRFGSLSLAIKHRLSIKSYQTNQTPLVMKADKPTTFDFNKPKENVITFSLFGDKKRYTGMAIENMRALRHVYPGWSARFYVDRTVPMGVIEELASRGADIRMMDQANDPATLSGTFWRFLVADDENVSTYLIRDCDSVINIREKCAVDEWLDSGRPFHVIRDFSTHSELMLAGLWGGRSRLMGMDAAIKAFQAEPKTAVGKNNSDQLFLRNHVWPVIAEHVLEHDSQFQSPRGDEADSTPLPPYGRFHPNRHVGQDMNVFIKA